MPVTPITNAVAPSAIRRLGQEVVFRVGTGTNLSLSSLVEGDDIARTALANPEILFFVGSVVWRGLFVFGSLEFGVAGITGAPGNVTQLLDPPVPAGSVNLGSITAAEDLLFTTVSFTSPTTGEFEFELWVLDGTGPDPTRISFGPEQGGLGAITAIGRRLLIARANSVGIEQPWISDGTSAGTVQLAQLAGGGPTGGVSFSEVAVTDGERAWFVARNGSNGSEVWVTDGTPTGTQIFAEVAAGPASSAPTDLVLFQDRLAFRANGAGVSGVWTVPLAGGAPVLLAGVPSAAKPLPLRALEGPAQRLYLNAPALFLSSALWVWDGPGTSPQSVGAPAFFGTVGPEIVEVATDGTVVFRASTVAAGVELFRWDGGATGPELLVDVVPGAGGSSPGNIQLAGDRVLFTAVVQGFASTLFGIRVADLGLSSMHTIGVGCDGAARLTGTGLPAPGASVGFQLADGVPGTVAALVIGSSLLPAPEVGLCSASIDGSVVLGIANLDATGSAGLPVTVPAVPSLEGAVFRAQSFELEPGGPVLGSYRASNVVEIFIGD